MSNIKMTDLISKLDENFVEDVCWNDTHTADVSTSEIRKKVDASITSERRQKHVRFKIALAFACIIVMIISWLSDCKKVAFVFLIVALIILIEEIVRMRKYNNMI